MEKQFKYEITLSFDLGKAVAKVGELADDISDRMNDFGLDGRLVLRGRLPLTLTCNIELDGSHRELLKAELERGMNGRFQRWDWRVEKIIKLRLDK